ncbi:chain length determinant protein EpsF [Sulfuritalea sp.]|uniref:chain length determinant protein EpsF n=1 Tax=Sulfuritalea sp. TaxID=2480090 RepID=UPI001AD25BC6|nr:chain length determinant protein EpsF [Sulfuritalea sp.]MBN8474877.1 chain length determinant protein EpsF [Sulfuritalea sp.]
MTPQQFFLIIFARRHLAASIFVLVAATGAAITMLMPKVYTATTSMVVDVKSDPIAGALLPTVGTPTYMATQTEIISSERTAIGVVRLLRVDQNPQLVAQWKEATNGTTPLENYFARLLRSGMTVSPARGSNIINLSYSGRDPKFATTVANAYTQAYIDLLIDMRVDPARQYSAWFDERLKVLRANLEKAQAKLSAYQREKGIVASDERVDQETTRLNALEAQLAAIQGERVDTSSRQRSSGSELSPDVQQNPIIVSLKGELAKSEARLIETSGTMGKNHPVRMQLEGQIAGLKEQLEKEMRRISGGAATATRTTAMKETELRQLIEEQKKQVLALRETRDEITVLNKDVESAQRSYESVAQRMSQLSLEAQSEQANVRVLSPAIEPSEPSRPNIPRFLAASLVGGILVGILAALGLEFLDRRVRDKTDLAVDGVPVFGVIGPIRDKYTFRQRLDLLRAFVANHRQRRAAKRRALLLRDEANRVGSAP